jgi:hypothetical protein
MTEDTKEEIYNNSEYIFLNAQKKRIYPADKHSFEVLRSLFRNIKVHQQGGDHNHDCWQISLANIAKKIPTDKYQRSTINDKRVIKINKDFNVQDNKQENKIIYRGLPHYEFQCEYCGYKLRTNKNLIFHRTSSKHRLSDIVSAQLYYPNSSLKFMFLIKLIKSEDGKKYLKRIYENCEYFNTLPENTQEEIRIFVRNI